MFVCALDGCVAGDLLQKSGDLSGRGKLAPLNAKGSGMEIGGRGGEGLRSNLIIYQGGRFGGGGDIFG